jgi:hypothetical protein
MEFRFAPDSIDNGIITKPMVAKRTLGPEMVNFSSVKVPGDESFWDLPGFLKSTILGNFY